MEIEIKEDEYKIVVSNENLNNDNFVNFRIDAENQFIDAIIGIEELYSAVKTFYELRTRRQKFDNLLK